jgi:hypothetical protein
MLRWLKEAWANNWILFVAPGIFAVLVDGGNIWQALIDFNDRGNAFIDPFEESNYALLYHSLIIVAASCILVFHLRQSNKGENSGIAIVFLTFAAIFGIGLIIIVLTHQKVTASFIVTNCYVYGVMLFIGLCDLLLEKWGKRLTLSRGENWTKEIDYIYLGLGIVGAIGSMNKITELAGQFSMFDPVAPIVLTTAIVFRFIKTRAEVGSWNKRHFYGLPELGICCQGDNHLGPER